MEVKRIARHEWRINSGSVDIFHRRKLQLGVDVLDIGRGPRVELRRRNLGPRLRTGGFQANGRPKSPVQIGLGRQNRIKSRIGKNPPHFFREKEKCLFLFGVVDVGNKYWATEGSTKVVVPEWWPRNAAPVVEKRIRVEHVIAEKFVKTAVKSACA